MKGLALLAFLFSTAMAVAVRNKSFSCPDKTWGGCCDEKDENGAGHTCHDANAVGRNNEYTCSDRKEYDMCCHFAPWVVHAAHPLICV
ncbi:hypothetical protein DL95DRAFT_390386 [Leptodontidium sp. 2 PMI_412]|nr:hypothetical protein DL95DRAFT_390386 [Leptodontidium sp. 2 PMI_412]